MFSGDRNPGHEINKDRKRCINRLGFPIRKMDKRGWQVRRNLNMRLRKTVLLEIRGGQCEKLGLNQAIAEIK